MITVEVALAAETPSSPWDLINQNGCKLVRSLYSGSVEVQFIIDLSVLDRTSLSIRIPSKPGKYWVNGGFGATLRLTPSQQVLPVFWHQEANASGTTITIGIPARTLDTISNADVVQLMGINGAIASFPTDQIRNALPELVSCKEALERQYDIAPEEDIAAAAGVTMLKYTKASTEQTRKDYPAEAVRDRVEGSTTVLWSIKPDGTTSDCRVLISSGSNILDLASCNIVLQRVRYEPGEVGVRRHGTRQFNWRLPARK